MKIGNINNLNYRDTLAQQKKRRFFIRLLLLFLSLLTVGGLIMYALFFSSAMRINDISIIGLKTIEPEEIRAMIEPVIEQSAFNLPAFKPRKNILFFDPEPVLESILAKFPIIKDIRITKDYFHKISFNITERTPLGTWCFTDHGSTLLTTGCSYFDDEGMLWGKALKSSGSLLLIVEDGRIFSEHQNRVESGFLENIQEAMTGLDGLGVKVNKVVIRPDSINDFYIYTIQGYYIIFSEEFPLAKQIEVLKIFLNEKGRDFKAEYIDLRIEGRVYYK